MELEEQTLIDLHGMGTTGAIQEIADVAIQHDEVTLIRALGSRVLKGPEIEVYLRQRWGCEFPDLDAAKVGVDTAKDTMDEILRRHGGEDDEEE